VLGAATFVGAASVLLSVIGFLRWMFVVPALADSYMAGDATTKAAVAAAWMAQHQFGGALIGEHLGQLLAIGWSVTVSALALRTGMLPRWVGWTGLVASALSHRPGRHPGHRRSRLPGLRPRWLRWQLAVGHLADRPGRGRAPSSDPPAHRRRGAGPKPH
jgi:hypothetical protein